MPRKQASATRLVFAANVRRLRLSLSLSQESLAEKASLHRNYIGAVERGEQNISIDNMEKIAFALNTVVEKLVAYSSERDKSFQETL